MDVNPQDCEDAYFSRIEEAAEAAKSMEEAISAIQKMNPKRLRECKNIKYSDKELINERIHRRVNELFERKGWG